MEPIIQTGFLVRAYNPCSWYRLLEPAGAYPGAKIILAPNGFTDYVKSQSAHCQLMQMGYVCQSDEIEFIGWLKRQGIKVAVDYDDNMFQMCPEPNREMVVRALALANLVTVPTEFLARLYGRHAKTTVAIIPNRLDLKYWTPNFKRPDPAEQIIAYSGSRCHTRDFAAVAAEAVWEVLRMRKTAKFRVIGCDPLSIPPDVADRVQELPWQPVHDHVNAIRGLNADIAIAPLVPDWFNRGRSELKWLQFGALGCPMVASDCEPYDQVVADGLTGFLAGDKKEWVDRLLMLVDSPRLRLEIGSSAANLVHWKYDLRDDAALRRRIYQTLFSAETKTA